jgi:membrane fusion protein (multidrug efflux system)
MQLEAVTRSETWPRSAVCLAVTTALLAGWTAWFLLARITLYEVGETARVEVAGEIHPVAARLAGRVVRSEVVLGRAVQPGDVLLELEAESQRLEREQERARLAALGPQLAALEQEREAEQQAGIDENRAARVALEEAQARRREAEAAAQFAQEERARRAQLYSAGLAAELEWLRAKSEVEKKQAMAESLRLAIPRLEREQRARAGDRQARLERLRREVERVQGEIATAQKALARLGHEMERRAIRAPVAGRLGEVAVLTPGAFVREGDRIAAILPAGSLRVVAHFAPPRALGRLRSGQRARLRLEGFPWAQYGSVPAVVSSVADEVREGRVRVELALRGALPLSIPLQHGLPGTVEVEVERIAPAALVLRLAGQRFTAPAAAEASGR